MENALDRISINEKDIIKLKCGQEVQEEAITKIEKDLSKIKWYLITILGSTSITLLTILLESLMKK